MNLGSCVVCCEVISFESVAKVKNGGRCKTCGKAVCATCVSSFSLSPMDSNINCEVCESTS